MREHLQARCIVWNLRNRDAVNERDQGPVLGHDVRHLKPRRHGVTPRVDDHLIDGENWWRQVFLIRRLTRQFDNSESGYLETLLHGVINSAGKIQFNANSNVSHFAGPDNTDTTKDLETRVLAAIKVALRLGGLRLETTQELADIDLLPLRRRADEQTK